MRGGGAQTAGVELVVAPVAIPDSDTTVELYLYDSGGQDIFREQLNTFVRWSTRPGNPSPLALREICKQSATVQWSGASLVAFQNTREGWILSGFRGRRPWSRHVRRNARSTPAPEER